MTPIGARPPGDRVMAIDLKPNDWHTFMEMMRRLAVNTERIADALEAANANEIAYGEILGKALEGEPGKESAADPLAGIPESERYRFGR
jgi:hypothetical protein